MVERYKVLGAMLALGEFTVPELARYSGVKQSTVRTVISRERRFLDEIGQEETGRRGGQFIRYRIRPEHIEPLRLELDQLLRELQNPFISTQPKVPHNLVAVEDLLLRQYPQATDLDQKQHLLELARIGLMGGQAEAEELLAEPVDRRAAECIQAYINSVEGLRLLSMAELTSEQNPGLEQPAAFSQAYDQLMTVADVFSKLGEDDHATAIRERVQTSPIVPLQRVETQPLREAVEAAAATATAELFFASAFSYLIEPAAMWLTRLAAEFRGTAPSIVWSYEGQGGAIFRATGMAPVRATELPPPG